MWCWENILVPSRYVLTGDVCCMYFLLVYSWEIRFNEDIMYLMMQEFIISIDIPLLIFYYSDDFLYSFGCGRLNKLNHLWVFYTLKEIQFFSRKSPNYNEKTYRFPEEREEIQNSWNWSTYAFFFMRRSFNFHHFESIRRKNSFQHTSILSNLTYNFLSPCLQATTPNLTKNRNECRIGGYRVLWENSTF